MLFLLLLRLFFYLLSCLIHTPNGSFCTLLLYLDLLGLFFCLWRTAFSKEKTKEGGVWPSGEDGRFGKQGERKLWLICIIRQKTVFKMKKKVYKEEKIKHKEQISVNYSF